MQKIFSLLAIFGIIFVFGCSKEEPTTISAAVIEEIESEEKIVEIIEEERSNKTDGPYEFMTAQEMQQTSQLERRTLAQQFDPGSIATSAKQTLSPNVIKEAYFLALIEVYSDNLLGLVDELNKFPGA